MRLALNPPGETGWRRVCPQDSDVPTLAARAQAFLGLDASWPLGACGTFHTLKSGLKTHLGARGGSHAAPLSDHKGAA